MDLTLSGTQSGTTTGNAGYFFSNLVPGAYTLTPSKDGYVFSPQFVDLVISNNDLVVNFGATPSSPLSGRIVFQSGGWIGGINADGNAYKSMLTPIRGILDSPSLSRDGRKIVYFRSFGAVAGIYTSNADGSNETLLRSASSGVTETRPKWSPDGTKIAFTRRDSSGNSIWVINANGGSEFQVPLGGLISKRRVRLIG